MNVEILIILGIFLVSYFLILRNFGLSVYVLLVLSVLLHKELFSFYRWDVLPIRMFMLALFCVGITKFYFWFIKSKDRKKEFLEYVGNHYFYLLLLLLLVRTLSIIFSKNLQSSIFMLGFFATVLVLVGMLLSQLKANPQKALDYLKFYIYIVFGLTLFGYFQYFLYQTYGIIIGAFWNIPGNVARVGATFWDVNHYGALIASLLPIMGVLILIEKSWLKKILYSIMLLSSTLTLFLTNSRTAWIMAGIALLSFVLIFLKKKIGYKGFGYLLLAFVLISIPLIREYNIKSSPFRATIRQYFHYRMDSFDSHILLLTGSVQIFEKYPILGGGYGSFFEHFSKTAVSAEFFGRDPAALNTRVPPHTIWGELISETGVLGLAVFILFTLVLIGTLLMATFSAKTTKDFLLSSAMASVVIGWFIAGIFYSYNSEFFWIVLTLFFGYGIGVLDKKFELKHIVQFCFKSKLFLPLCFLFLGGGLIFFNLGQNHLVPWDEAIYAKISKNMVVNNEYIVQTWIPGRVWYEKPPLYMWMMAGLMKVLGFTSWAAKLPSAILGFGTVIVVYLFARKLFNRTAGFISAFVLITTVHFLYYSRMSMTDVSATFFITLSLYLYYLATANKKCFLCPIAGIMIGLAVMIKGVVGLIPFPIIFLYEFYLYISKQQRFHLKRFFGYASLIFTFLLISMPWHIEMYRRFGNDFIGSYIGYHVIDRATNAIEDKGRPFYWYFIVMRVSMRLWFIGLLASLPFVVKKLIKNDNRLVFLTIWSVFILLFFSIAQSKLVWYIIPLYPAVSIIVGWFLSFALDFAADKFKFLRDPVAKFLVLFLFVIGGLMYLFYNSGLAYPSDLTGPQARLLQLKDATLGTEDRFYVDRVERPLVMFYTDSPFEIVNFNPEKGEVPVIEYTQQFVILAKSGRFSENIPLINGKPNIIGKDGDYILWYHNSGYKDDTNKLGGIKDSIKELEEKKLSGSFTGLDSMELTRLLAEQQTLSKSIQQKLDAMIRP